MYQFRNSVTLNFSELVFQFSHSVVSDSLWPPGLQHDRLPCPSPTPGAYSNSCPLSQWCHPTISSSDFPFSSRLQSFPASGSFPMSQFFTSSSQSIGVSASASVLPMNIQDWFPLGWTGSVFRGKEKWHNKYMDTLNIISSTFFLQISLSLSESNQEETSLQSERPNPTETHNTHTLSIFLLL